jgi:hypothetical protein
MNHRPRQGRAPHDGPAVERLAVSVYRVPTDLPGGDATLIVSCDVPVGPAQCPSRRRSSAYPAPASPATVAALPR